MMLSHSVCLPRVLQRYDGFELDIGEIFLEPRHLLGVFGHSGSGKSTYVRGLVNLLRRDGVKVAYLTQRDQSFGHLTVQQNLELFGLAAGGVPSKDTEQMACRLGLEDKLTTRCDKLSGGQRRRVSIAGTLAGDSSVILLDEPFGGIGWYYEEIMRRLLLDYSTKGRTIVVVSHDYDLLWSLSDRVLVISEGQEVGLLETSGDTSMSSKTANVIGMTNVVDVSSLRTRLQKDVHGLDKKGIIGFWPHWARIAEDGDSNDHSCGITVLAVEIKDSRNLYIRGEQLLEIWVGDSPDYENWIRFVIRDPNNIDIFDFNSISILIDKFTILRRN